jgi:hypothetical protein
MQSYQEEISHLGQVFRVTSYFIHENEDMAGLILTHKLADFGIAYNEILKNRNNNRIGYFQASVSPGEYIKVYVFPKTVVPNNDDPSHLLSQFNNYFSDYFRLRKHYAAKGYTELKDNLIDTGRAKIESIEDYISRRYDMALSEVRDFFRRHNKEHLETEYFFSQEITSGINLKKNIVEINKSNIHQAREIQLNYSKIAEIAIGTLTVFSREKVPLLGNTSLDNKVKQLHNLIHRYLRGKFTLNNRKLSISTLYNRLNGKDFKKSKRLERLQENLLVLLGVETAGSGYKISNVDSIWFSPEYMYELSVREQLEQLQLKLDFEHQFKLTKNYYLLAGGHEVYTNNSIPDNILNSSTKGRIIIDAKWKILRNWSDIGLDDVMKIYRDRKVFSEQGNELPIAILAYPKVEIPLANRQLPLSYSFNEEVKFYIVQLAPFQIPDNMIELSQLFDTLPTIKANSIF